MYWFRQAASNGDAASARIVGEPLAPLDEDRESALAADLTKAGLPVEPLGADVPQEPDAGSSEAGLDAAEADLGAAVADLPESRPSPAEPVGGAVNAAPEARSDVASYEDWIRQRDPEHYTIQVIALQQIVKLHEFIAQHPDWAPFAIYQSSYQGKPLYVMIQGDYDDLAQAREAVRTFPAGMQKREELWIRRYMMVQGALP